MRAKTLLTIAISFSFIISAKSQINKGSIFLGGSINYNDDQTSSYYYKTESFGTNVQIGKFIKTNTVVGLIGSYNNFHYNTVPASDSSINKSNGFTVGLFYRTYKKLLKDFYVFGEFQGVYTHSDNHQKNNNNGNDFFDEKNINDGASINFVPGLSYAICKKAQIELLMVNIASLSYVYSKEDIEQGTPAVTSKNSGHRVGANVNLNSNFLSNFGIGFKFIFS